jgi:hypothetical protein
VVTPRYVSYETNFIYCAEPFTVPAKSVLSVSQDELPSAFDRSRGYFNVTEPMVAAVSVTGDEPLGNADRHLGYSVAYSDEPFVFPDNCDTIHEVFLPIVLKRTQ